MITPTSLIAEAQALLAQAQALLPWTPITDTLPRPWPVPPPTLGPAGTSIVDPVFGSTLCRMTDQTSDPSGCAFRTPSSADSRGWSADGLHLWSVCENGNIYLHALNAGAGTTAVVGLMPFNAEPAFDDLDPDLIYGAGQAYANHVTIVAYNLVTKQSSVLVDLSQVSTPAPANTYTGQLMVDGRTVVVIYGGASQDQHYLIYLRNLTTGMVTILNALTTPGLGFHLHTMAIDKTGRYLTLYPSAADLASKVASSQVYLWDLVENTWGPIMASPQGHVTSGYGYGVNQDVASGVWDAAQWCLRSFAAPQAPSNLIQPILTPPRSVTTMGFADHTSWGQAQAGAMAPVLSSTYAFGAVSPIRAWDNELILIPTDGSGTPIQRICHTHADAGSDANEAVYQFEYTPRGNVSPNGQWAYFTSNWQKTLGLDPDGGLHRTDLFLVALP